MASHTPKGQLSRERALAAAAKLFAELGFHGVGLREIAQAADMPLAGIQYHFGKKEKLYAEVLAVIAREVAAELAIEETSQRPYHERFDLLVRSLVRWALDRPLHVRLLLRELLDNPRRVAKAEVLPLGTVLRSMAASFAEGQRLGLVQGREPEIAVLHLVGAVSYYVAARPTFRRLVGVAADEAVLATYPDEFALFAKNALGLQPENRHGSANANQPRSSRSRAHRTSHD